MNENEHHAFDWTGQPVVGQAKKDQTDAEYLADLADKLDNTAHEQPRKPSRLRDIAARLAQPTTKPVAWRYTFQDAEPRTWFCCTEKPASDTKHPLATVEPLYASPPLPVTEGAAGEREQAISFAMGNANIDRDDPIPREVFEKSYDLLHPSPTPQPEGKT